MALPALERHRGIGATGRAAVLLLAALSTHAGAQTFIILTPDGARFASAPAGVAPDHASGVTTVGPSLGGIARPGTPAGETHRVTAGAPMPRLSATTRDWPRAHSLDLSLDVEQFLPAERAASPAADDGATSGNEATRPAGESFLPIATPRDASTTASAQVAGATTLLEPRRVRGQRNHGDDLALKFNVRGFSLLQMDGDAETQLQFSRVREREWRRPILSLTLQKKF